MTLELSRYMPRTIDSVLSRSLSILSFQQEVDRLRFPMMPTWRWAGRHSRLK